MSLTNHNLNPKLLNPLTLAFMGDCVYEILVREHIIRTHGSLSANKLHKLAVTMVCCSAQSKVYGALEPILSEEELAIFKRGRNANISSSPKHSSLAEYRRATGLECLFGYLHLCGRQDRIEELFAVALRTAEEDIHEGN